MTKKFMTTNLLLAIAGSTKKVVEKSKEETLANCNYQEIIWSRDMAVNKDFLKKVSIQADEFSR
ncbi:MAG: hypothetical protein ACOVNY_12120 [Chitinophagaceae bacterium]